VHVRSDHDSELAAVVERLSLTVHLQEPVWAAGSASAESVPSSLTVSSCVPAALYPSSLVELLWASSSSSCACWSASSSESAAACDCIAERTDSSEDTESSGDDTSETSLAAAATGADAGSSSKMTSSTQLNPRRTNSSSLPMTDEELAQILEMSSMPGGKKFKCIEQIKYALPERGC
jgi:hypothetical protein